MELTKLRAANHVAGFREQTVHRKTIARMFDSPVLEVFSKTHPIVPALIYGPLSAWMIAVSLEAGPLLTLASLAVGGGVWTLAEYLLHRFVFHVPDGTPVGRWLYFYTHGIHHYYPDDYYRLVMVPVVSLPLAVVFYGVFAATLPGAWVAGSFAGFVLGYLVYDYAHFATHFVAAPKHPALGWLRRIMKEQRRRHMIHHFDDPTHGFGVSTGLWDAVFDTAVADRK